VRDSRGFTLVELLLVILILGILMAISVANYRQARLRGSEASAIGSLVAINQAQFAYMQTCGSQRFAPKLSALGKPHPGSNSAFLSPDLTGADEVEKGGYRFVMDGAEPLEPRLSCTGDTSVEGYHVTADPVASGTTGNRFFGTNTSLVVYEALESFSGKMPETGAPPTGTEVTSTAR
jgi:type IV pilus assembly protein PilA